MTPFDVVALQGQAPGEGGEGLQPKTVVQKQINISTPEEARGILRQVLSQALGRGPSESELTDFQGQLNAAQRAQPSVTTTHYNAAGTRSSSTTPGGVSPEQFAQDYADREFGSEERDYHVVSQYMPDLFDALRTPVEPMATWDADGAGRPTGLILSARHDLVPQRADLPVGRSPPQEATDSVPRNHGVHVGALGGLKRWMSPVDPPVLRAVTVDSTRQRGADHLMAAAAQPLHHHAIHCGVFKDEAHVGHGDGGRAAIHDRDVKDPFEVAADVNGHVLPDQNREAGACATPEHHIHEEGQHGQAERGHGDDAGALKVHIHGA